MTIEEMIKELKEVREKYGNVPVFFDCPYCDKSYTPDKLVAVVAHFREKTGNK